jgi:Chaperone of endosialidase
MASAIDATKPIYGTPTTESVRLNFATAKIEIEALQLNDNQFLRIDGTVPMAGPLRLFGDPTFGNEATNMNWVLNQLHSTINTLIFVGNYDASIDRVLTSGQPSIAVNSPLPAGAPANTQFYFTIPSGKGSATAIGNQPVGGVPAGSWLISNGVNWNVFTMSAPGVIAQGVPVSPAIVGLPGTNVYDTLVSVPADYVAKAGSTMTGLLTLSGNPSTANHAANKAYVDTTVSGLAVIPEPTSDAFHYARGGTPTRAWTNAPKFSSIDITNTNNQIILHSTSGIGNVAVIHGRRDNNMRWRISLPDDNEDFTIARFNDAGVIPELLQYALKIERSSGNAFLSHSLYFDMHPNDNAVPVIYGRSINPVTAGNDRLDILARNGPASSVISLRGPTNSAANTIWLGNNATGLYTQITADASIITPSTIYINADRSIAFGYPYLPSGAYASIVKQANSTWIFNCNQDHRYYWDSASGTWLWQSYPNFVTNMQIDMNGNFFARSSVAAGAADFQLYVSNNNRFLQLATHWYWGWFAASGDLSYYVNESIKYSFRFQDYAFIAWSGPMYATSFQPLSDERTKTKIQRNKYGIDDICQLETIEYERTDAPGVKDIGFTAQQIQPIMPEAVSLLGDMPDGGIKDALAINTMPILAGIVESIKTLRNEINTLKGV